MSINRDKINKDLSLKRNRPSAINAINTQIGEIAFTKTVNDSTILGQSAGQIVNGFKSLEQTQDFPNSPNTSGTALTQITEAVSGLGALTNLDEINFNLSTPSVDTDALNAEIDKLVNADSDTDLTGMFSNVGSIGGGAADTVASIIKIITLLGTVSKLTNISIGGSATDALSAAGGSIADKASSLTGSISDAVGNLGDLADVSSLSELTSTVKNIKGDLNSIVGAVSAVSDFNPLADGLSSLTGELGVASGLSNLTKGLSFPSGLNDVTSGIGNILNKGLSSVTGEVFGNLGGLIRPINSISINSAGGVLQNINEAFNQEFTKNIVNLTGGVLVGKKNVSSLMNLVTSRDPLQVAQAAKFISQNSNRIPDSMKSIISGLTDNDFTTSKELIDKVVSKASREKVSKSVIDQFLDQFKVIEDLLPSLSTTIQSNLERTDDEFFKENVNLKDYGANYQNNPDSGFIRGASINDVPSRVRDLFREVPGGIVHVPKKLTQQEYEAFAKRLERSNGIDWLSRYPTQEDLDAFVRRYNGGTSALVDFGISVTLSHLKFANGGGRRTSSSSTTPSTTSTFTTVDSKEELGQEIMLITRPILYLVVHSTDSYNNQFLTSNEIDRDHIGKGFDGIQYHYVVRRDGTLQRGRPTNKTAQASPSNLRNFTIDLVLVGGINAPSGVKNPDQYKSIEAFTREQLTTLESIIEAFYRRYPGGLVRGHYQIEDGVQDPHFDVAKFVKNRFGR